MKTFEITFSYTIEVVAEDKNEAIDIAKDDFDNTCPRTDEMNIITKEVN
jgi:hypothetical protein